MSLTTNGSAAQPAGLQAAITALASKPSEMRLCLINVDPLFDSIQDFPCLVGLRMAMAPPGDGVRRHDRPLADMHF
ncbi:hypothetical protein D3C80_2052690 [compost metagenome]